MSDRRNLLASALDELPDVGGGAAIVIATGSRPPAMAVLSTGDVLIQEDRVSVAVLATSSVVQRLAGSFTLLVPHEHGAIRVEVMDVTVEMAGALARVDGTVHSLRETLEPPWRLEMGFSAPLEDDHAKAKYVDFWRSVRSWLSGELTDPPSPPR